MVPKGCGAKRKVETTKSRQMGPAPCGRINSYSKINKSCQSVGEGVGPQGDIGPLATTALLYSCLTNRAG